MPTAMLGALAVRGRYLHRAVEREGIATLETWPAGTLLQLAPRGAVKPSSSKDPGSYTRWARTQLEPHITADWVAVEGPDDVDAIAAAYAGWRHLTGTGCLHVGEPPICVAVSGSDTRG